MSLPNTVIHRLRDEPIRAVKADSGRDRQLKDDMATTHNWVIDFLPSDDDTFNLKSIFTWEDLKQAQNKSACFEDGTIFRNERTKRYAYFKDKKLYYEQTDGSWKQAEL